MSLACLRCFDKKNNIGINVYGCEETKDDEKKEAPFYEKQEVEANENDFERYKDTVNNRKSVIKSSEKN